MSRARYRLAGRVTVPLPPSVAFTLFTPRGEERWVDGWQPRFPTATDDDSAPGTVFVTAVHGEETTWVVLDREPGRRMSYARVTPKSRAGTVSVLLEDDGNGHSAVEVTYDLTGLSSEGDQRLAELAAGYSDMLKSWESAISTMLAQQNPRT
jgi:hypothetical protein